MPKRTNDFQQLVLMIQQALAKDGVVVRESAELQTSHGRYREVDILIEVNTGLYTLKIAVEAKAEGRALDATAIEEIVGKYHAVGSPHLNQVVVVSRSGFTKQAMEIAVSNNIKLFTLKEATDPTRWQELLPGKGKSFLKVQLPPRIRGFAFYPPLPWDGRMLLSSGRMKCLCCGRDKGTVKDQIDHLAFCHVLPSPEIAKAIKSLPLNPQGKVELKVEVPLQRHTAVAVLQAATLVEHIKVEIMVPVAQAELRFKLWEQTDESGNSRIIRHGIADIMGGRFNIVLPDGLTSPKISVRFEPPPPTSECCS